MRQAVVVRTFLVCVLLAGACFPPAPVSWAEVRGEIVGPGRRRLPVAVASLKWLGGERRRAEADGFVSALTRDLELSGLFHVIDSRAHIEDPQTSGTTAADIDFEDWAALGAMGLFRGGYHGTETGLAIEGRYFDVVKRESRGGRRLEGTSDGVGRMAHRMADAVLELVTGRLGPFDSRIAFVSDRDSHFRELYEYGFDGSIRRLTRHRSVTMAPAWHPGAAVLAFTTFRERRPALFSIDLASGGETRLTSRLGVNVGAAFSPDGRTLLLAREDGGNTDIYLLDPSTGRSKRLTKHWAIDVDPSWSPDGRRIAFCSSRGGEPQIYTMKADGGGVRRLSFEGDYNCSPAFSPDGRTIAFAGRKDGRFQIFTVPAAGGRTTQLTFSGANEDPAWSPDSRYIAFSSGPSGERKIHMVDASGRWRHQLTGGNGDDTSPSWSTRRGAPGGVR